MFILAPWHRVLLHRVGIFSGSKVLFEILTRFTALTFPDFHVILPPARGVAANVLDVCLGSGLPASIGACRTLAVFVDESI